MLHDRSERDRRDRTSIHQKLYGKRVALNDLDQRGSCSIISGPGSTLDCSFRAETNKLGYGALF
jgi:hypothetical protein